LNGENGEKSSCDKEKAEVLSKHFVSTFTKEPPGILPTPRARQFEEEVTDVRIDRLDIEKKLKELKVTKAMGPDGIHPFILKSAAEILCKPLEIIFRKSLDEGNLPKQWKEAYITALHKKGDKQRAQNYRPVSLTSIVCKLLESIIRGAIVEHMKRFQQISDSQYGFVQRRSTTLQLLHTVEDWIQLIDEGKTVDVCYLDMMKAFDSVPHQRLLAKIHSYGIRGKIMKWIASFLCSRKQTVRLENGSSNPQEVLSGVPQGSVLGPTLFIIYINDLPETVASKFKMYADDAKLYKAVSTPQDEAIFEQDIDSLQDWSRDWLLKFHPEKCAMVRIGTKPAKCATYSMKKGDSSTDLEWVASQKDLGVIVDGKLSFSEEIGHRVKKANSIVGIIRRSFTYLDNATFALLFKALVRPHLEYAAPIWNPHLKKRSRSPGRSTEKSNKDAAWDERSHLP
jgi:hypothetical protein